MTIGELVSNSEFNFNAPYRIYRYEWGDDEMIKLFDSDEPGDVPSDLLRQYITAINVGDDGVLEIEFTGMELF